MMDFLKAFFYKRPVVITLLMLSAVAFLIYSNGLNGPFVFDDYSSIRNNPHVRMNEITADYFAKLAKFPSEQRPIPNLSFALNYYFDKYDVTGYHVVNIIIHILCAFLVFLIFRQTLYLTGRKNDLLAAAAALFWLVNPVHTQSVTYIVQRMTSMCTMFYLLSLYTYIKARIDRESSQVFDRKSVLLFAASFISFVAALLSKQIAATLPVFILLYEWFFIRDLDTKWFEKNIKWIGLGFITIAVIGFVYLHFVAMDQILLLFEKQDFTLVERLLTEPRVVIFYLSLLLLPLPSRLNLEHDITVSTSLVEPLTTFLSIAAIIALLVVAVFAARKKYKILSFAILWFLGNLVIESSIIPLALAYDHRTYLPSVFILLAVPYYLFAVPKNYLKPAAALFACLIFLFSGLTLARNHTWADLERFHKDCLEKSPRKPRVVLNMGVVYQNQKEYENALKYFNRAKKLKPGYGMAYEKIGLVYLVQDKLEAALKNLEKAIRLKPDSLQVRKNLGIGYRKFGKIDKAISFTEELLQHAPDYIPARVNLAKAYVEKKQYDQALTELRKVVELDPENYQAHNSIGNVLMEMGKNEEALEYFASAVKYDPEPEKAHLNLGILYLKKDNFSKAEEHFLDALNLAPESYEALKETGDLYFEQKKYSKAEEYYKKAGNSDSEKAYPIVQLGIINLHDKNYEESEKYLARALEKGGAKHLVYYYLGLCALGEDDFEKGVKRLKQSVEANPEFFKAKVKLADAYMATENYDKALHTYNEVLEKNAEDLHCLKRAAQIHMEKKRHEKALQKYEKAYQVDSQDPSVIQNLAFLYAEFEKYGKAAAKFEALKKFKKETPLLYYNLACMYSESGEKQKALDNLEQALEYGYDNKSKLMNDKNLDFIRNSREFKELVAKL